MQSNTLAILEAIEHLGEIGRLFLMLGRRGLRETEEAALVESCKRTAGLSSRYPRPKPALALAIQCGLLNLAGGVVRATERGKLFFSKGAKSSLELSIEQARLLLGSLLDDISVEQKIKTLFNHFQVINGELAARKNAVLESPDLLLFCRLLQQIGALRSAGDYFVLVSSFDSIVETLVIRAARLSQQELLDRLERQRQRGEIAEQFVLEFERKRLLAIDRPDLAGRVKRISIEDAGAGYDIRSFEKNQKTRFIEVKSSVGGQILFEWSDCERLKAKKERGAYYIYFVPFSFSLPHLVAPIVAINDPVSRIERGALAELPCHYRVSEQGHQKNCATRCILRESEKGRQQKS